MTFYEAALRILEGEGRPLHFLEITQKSIAQSLLSHVGKTPEQTMLSRLAAMARRTREKRVIVTAKDTFALIDWQLIEDAEALAQTGLVEENPEELLPPLRPVERHPEQRTENARAAGRQDRKRRRDEGDDEGRGRKRRYPPIPEVVFEILTEPPGALTAADLVTRALERELCSEELSAELVLTALLEDNQRRIDAGRRPQFILTKETQQISLERAGAPSEAPPLELQAAFAELLGIPLEGGRPVLRTLSQPPGSSTLPGADLELVTAAKDAVKEARRAIAKTFRRRLQELDAGTFEKTVVKMLHHAHFREIKVGKRSKEGPLLTARRKEGSVEMRFAIRLLKAGAAVERRAVQELRRDLNHHAAHVGLIISSGEVRGDARGEVQGNGALIMLWCGDALAEKFFETRTGVTVTQVELFEPDEAFFASARVDAEESLRRREERAKERELNPDRPRREDRDRSGSGSGSKDRAEPAALPSDGIPASLTRSSEDSEAGVSGGEPASSPRADARSLARLAEDSGESGSDAEGDDEGDDDLEAASDFVSGGARPEGAAGGAEGEGGRRRRRRRRGRRGRGPKPGEAGAAPAEGGAAPTSAPAEAGAPGEAPPAEAAPYTESRVGAVTEAAERPAPSAPAAAEPAPAASPAIEDSSGSSSDGGSDPGTA